VIEALCDPELAVLEGCASQRKRRNQNFVRRKPDSKGVEWARRLAWLCCKEGKTGVEGLEMEEGKEGDQAGPASEDKVA